MSDSQASVAVGIDAGHRLTKVTVAIGDERRELTFPAGVRRSEMGDVLASVESSLPRSPAPRSVVLAGRSGASSTMDLTTDHNLLAQARKIFGVDDALLVDSEICIAAAESVPVSSEGGPEAGTHQVVIVCDVGTQAISAATCVRGADGWRRLQSEPDRPSEAEAVAEVMREFGTVLARTLREAGGLPAGNAWPAMLREQEVRARRAELLLARAEKSARYGASPVYFPAEPGPGATGVTSADLARMLQPVARAAGELVDRLMIRSREPVAGAGVLVAGGCGRLAPVSRSVATAVSRRRTGAPRVVDLHAASRGAALIAADRVRVQTDYPHTLRLRLRRTRSGLLETVDVTLAEAGRPPAVPVQVDGEPLTFTLSPDDVGSPLPLEVYDERSAQWQPVSTPASARPLADRYHVGVHLGRSSLGVLVLQPVDTRAPAVVVPLDQPTPIGGIR